VCANVPGPDGYLLAVRPSKLTAREAASLPLVFITAWEGLVDRVHVGPNDTVLIHGGAGGVGHTAVQIASAFGARVFATGSSANRSYIEQLGEVRVYDYVDQHVPMLLRMFEKRLTAYRAIGYARGEAPLGFPEPLEEPIVEYDQEALRHFEDDL
jgi:NADPH:quinone reductase-like Zn-dependent oxidoreductase